MNSNSVVKEQKNIVWIYGKTGTGKTTLAKDMTKNKTICPLLTDEFLALFLKSFEKEEKLINFIRKYEVLILDHADLCFMQKPATQEDVKKLLLKIVANSKTKVILITCAKPRNLKKLQFNSENCIYIKLKEPTNKTKLSLVKNLIAENNLYLSELKISEIVNNSPNLFYLKGLFNNALLGYGSKSKI